jgi:hypothetical protein
MRSSVRVEKHKWDGTVSSVVVGRRLHGDERVVMWFVPAGTRRERPAKSEVEAVPNDEIWAAVPGEWWVLCGRAEPGRSITGYVLHAAAPVEPPIEDELSWIDLDLDFEMCGDEVALVDETDFHAHARTMDYPDDVVRGAWAGISEIAPRYTTREWPFDGWMQRSLDQARDRS